MKSTFEDERGPRCFLHAMSPEEMKAHAKRGAKASSAVRFREPLPQSDLRTGIDTATLYRTLSEALVATNELGLPDWSARLSACAVLVLAAPRYYRTTPEEAQQLLVRVLLNDVPVDPERVKVEQTFKRLRSEWWSLPAVHPLRGLVARPLPRQFVLPWEDYSTVLRLERPEDIPIDQVETVRLPSGKLAIRDGGHWQEVPEAGSERAEDGGLIRAVSNVS